jgi:lipopolysaccharide transport system ATP-binding protein
MSKAIQVEGVSKQYRLGQIGTGSLVHDVNRWWHQVRGKEDPYLKIGEANDRSTKGSSQYVWSLRDISFDIEQGDSVGIIGRNGAGKSTLLKILSRVTAPTTGNLKVKGRIASLLEVGTGFHPDLSGRDNIYLNGAILGMRKHEITRKFDEIVDFAGVERYIDTPVKRYSSGMYVRLAFAVAAYLESEILIVDEVLAVGDAEFQKKCLGKMNDVSKGEGRTVLFVSHQMNSIEKLCNVSILMDKGKVKSIGDTKAIVSEYLRQGAIENSIWENRNDEHKYEAFQPMRMSMVDSGLEEKEIFSNDDKIGVCIEGVVEKVFSGFCYGFALYNATGTLLFWTLNTDKSHEEWVNLTVGYNRVIAFIPPHFLNEGEYRVELITAIHFKEWYCQPEVNSPAISFQIFGGLSKSPQWVSARPGVVAPILDYRTI